MGSRVTKFLKAAKILAELSQGVGGSRGNNFRLGALIVDGARPISLGFNSYSRSTKLMRHYKYPYYHAEADAIIHNGFRDLRGCDMYVVRLLKSGQFALARPCPECVRFMALVGIQRCFFSTSDGYGKIKIRR